MFTVLFFSKKKEIRVKMNFIHKRAWYPEYPPPTKKLPRKVIHVPLFTPVESMKIEIFEIDENILHFGT